MELYDQLLNVRTQGIDSPRVKLRELSLEDAADMFEYTSSPVTCKFLKWGPHTSITEAVRYIEGVIDRQHAKSLEIVWGIELKETKKLIGVLRVYNISNKCASVSYILNHRYTGRGLMTEALKSSLSVCMEQFNFEYISAFYVEENDASRKVMERCGMKPSGNPPEKEIVRGHSTLLYEYRKEKVK